MVTEHKPETRPSDSLAGGRDRFKEQAVWAMIPHIGHVNLKLLPQMRNLGSVGVSNSRCLSGSVRRGGLLTVLFVF